MIEGVVVKELKKHNDERGYFCELIRKTDPFFGEGFAQLNHSYMYQDTVKAWHYHKNQVDWWYVPFGVVRGVLYDMRQDSNTYTEINEFMMGDDQKPIIIKIPCMVAHGCKVIQGPASMFYVTSNIYDPEDEGRLDYNDAKIGYDWLKRSVIK